MKFNSRRTSVYATHGMVASSQPLASMAGLRILQAGGNAADAAVATAAALNVTEPCSTGIGGDCFCIYYDADKGRVQGLNGSGRAPAALTPGLLNDLGHDEMPRGFSMIWDTTRCLGTGFTRSRSPGPRRAGRTPWTTLAPWSSVKC